MNRNEFLRRLEVLLSDISKEEREKRHFNIIEIILRMQERNMRRMLFANWEVRKRLPRQSKRI